MGQNTNMLLTGATGSGKSSLVRYLLNRSPRWIVFDPLKDYNNLNAAYYDNPKEAAEYILRNYDDPNMRMVFQLDDSSIWENLQAESVIFEPFRKILHLFLYTLFYNDAAPAGLVLDESHFYVEGGYTREPWNELRATYRFAGRRASVSAITVIQKDTDIDPAMRQGSAIVVAMLNTDPSSTTKTIFGARTQSLVNLQKYNWKDPNPPKYGVNYISSPANYDVVRGWLGIYGRENLVPETAQKELSTPEPIADPEMDSNLDNHE